MNYQMRCLSYALLLLMLAQFLFAAEPVTLTITGAETAGISGLKWDGTFPGATTMDAAQRSVLLRFPGATEQIAAKLHEGYTIEKAEVVMQYAGFELKPPDYILRHAAMVEAMKKNPPRWHVIAWALRKPWMADATLGPTYNAYINGVGYWMHFGAQDTGKDRFAIRFGPAELSEANPEARLDVTPIFVDNIFGKSLADRLPILDTQGLLLRKWETYDHRYDEWYSAYEWMTPTGGHGLTFKEPMLAVTFKRGRARLGKVAEPVDIVALAQQLKAAGGDGAPTAIMPTPDEIKAMAEKQSRSKPAWMSDRQWLRVQELRKIGGGVGFADALESGEPKEYEKVVSNIMRTVPRFWKGWGVQDDLLLWYIYKDMLPLPAQENLMTYWDSWLMPDRPTETFMHAQSRENEEYYKQTMDWRGRKSFFRGGYNYVISTMNFNHTAAMGALLGGDIIGSERAMADGRHGLEYLPLRLWAWYDGTTQESIDHYQDFRLTSYCLNRRAA